MFRNSRWYAQATHPFFGTTARVERQVLSLNLEIVSHKDIWDLRYRDCAVDLVSNLLILRCILSRCVSDSVILQNSVDPVLGCRSVTSGT
jgi:hypothetical protein